MSSVPSTDAGVRPRRITRPALVWSGLIVLTALALMLGGLFAVALLVALGLVGARFLSVARLSIVARANLVGSTVVGTSAAAYVWWVLGVQIDAADALRPAPAAAGYGGLGLIVVLLSIVTFVASAGVGYARRPR